MIPELFARFFGSLTRFALAGAVGWLVKKGVIDGKLGDDLLVAAVIAIPTLIWSLWQKYKDRLQFVTALGLPAGSTERDVKAVIDRGGGARDLLLGLLLFCVVSGAAMTTACGKEQIESAVTKTVVAVRTARKVTTTQHKYGHIDDSAYRARLNLFEKTYNDIDTLGDSLANFGEITPGNKQAVLDQLNALAGTIDQLVASGDLGVVNPKSQTEYRRWILLARGTLNAIKIAVAAVEKPVPVGNLKIPKASG